MRIQLGKRLERKEFLYVYFILIKKFDLIQRRSIERAALIVLSYLNAKHGFIINYIALI